MVLYLHSTCPSQISGKNFEFEFLSICGYSVAAAVSLRVRASNTTCRKCQNLFKKVNNNNSITKRKVKYHANNTQLSSRLNIKKQIPQYNVLP